MKKILSICLVLLTSFALCACSSEEEKEANKQQNYDAKLSDYYGFMYDYSGKEAEYTACQNIVAEYKKSLWVGAADVDETIAEMTKRLKAAGMDDLIQVKQEQLDKWMSNR